MVKLPATILRPLDSQQGVTEELIIKHFMLNGYGRSAAKKWIREFRECGWILDNPDGTVMIYVPYRLCQTKSKNHIFV